MSTPAPGEEQPHAPIHIGGYPAGKQVGRKEPGDPGRHQVEHEPAMCPSSKSVTWYPGIHWTRY